MERFGAKEGKNEHGATAGDISNDSSRRTAPAKLEAIPLDESARVCRVQLEYVNIRGLEQGEGPVRDKDRKAQCGTARRRRSTGHRDWVAVLSRGAQAKTAEESGRRSDEDESFPTRAGAGLQTQQSCIDMMMTVMDTHDWFLHKAAPPTQTLRVQLIRHNTDKSASVWPPSSALGLYFSLRRQRACCGESASIPSLHTKLCVST
ncbi:hypothetical protein DPEC_G00336740 [Dallia pectoralis]|uniref:Uncharacterized protein n=1 Tax=Dallia pectoralis TaxID=75939 RepID=A0ACC2F7I6_DALPE|nr:hypothetical protein DPEC_G00336740 [Dallia pectoralis]